MVVKNLSWVFSFANSVVGVGVLAMPFCFQKVCYSNICINFYNVNKIKRAI